MGEKFMVYLVGTLLARVVSMIIATPIAKMRGKKIGEKNARLLPGDIFFTFIESSIEGAMIGVMSFAFCLIVTFVSISLWFNWGIVSSWFNWSVG